MPDQIRIFWSDEDRGYIAVDDSRPGCCAFGMTWFEAATELGHAQEAWDMTKSVCNVGLSEQET